MEYTIIFNSGLSIEDTVSAKVNADSKEEALELALAENPEYNEWNKYVKNA
jgi:hypothetical protein